MSKQVISQELMDTIAIKSAELTLQGYGLNKIAEMLSKEMDISLNHKHIARYRKRDAYKNFMLEATENIRKTALSDLVRRVSDMVPLIEQTIVKNLEDGNINAVPHALKIMGLGEEEKKTGNSSLTVIMPGAARPEEKPVVDVTGDSDE